MCECLHVCVNDLEDDDGDDDVDDATNTHERKMLIVQPNNAPVSALVFAADDPTPPAAHLHCALAHCLCSSSVLYIGDFFAVVIVRIARLGMHEPKQKHRRAHMNDTHARTHATNTAAVPPDEWGSFSKICA